MCLDLPSSMHFSDILSLCMSILGLYGLIYYLRYLIPRNVLPSVSAVLTEAERLLDHAESTGAIPQLNDHRSTLITCVNRFLQMRMESHRAPGILQQLRLALWCGLTYKLYTLLSRVEATKIKIELAMDERRLTLLSVPIPQSATFPMQPVSIPVDNMRLACHEVNLKGYIAVIIAVMLMTHIVRVKLISHWHRQTLLHKCSEPMNLSSDHVSYSPDLKVSHFA